MWKYDRVVVVVVVVEFSRFAHWFSFHVFLVAAWAMATTKNLPNNFSVCLVKTRTKNLQNFPVEQTIVSFCITYPPGNWSHIPCFFRHSKVVSASQNQKPRHFCRFTGIGPYRWTAWVGRASLTRIERKLPKICGASPWYRGRFGEFFAWKKNPSWNHWFHTAASVSNQRSFLQDIQSWPVWSTL